MNIRAKIFGGVAESPLVSVKNPKGAQADALLTIPVVRLQSRHADTRLEDRFALGNESARLVRDGIPHAVKLINVCGGGAMVAAPFDAILWERLELHLGEHGAIDCSVIWIKHGRVGLEFAEETRLDCPQGEQSALLCELIRRHFPEARFDPPAFVSERSGDDQRDRPRNQFIWSGTLHCEYGSTPVRLRNISSDGAMIETSVELSPGAEPYLELGEAGAIFGTIVWQAGDQAGLRFQQPFDMARLAHARPEIVDAAESLVHFGSSNGSDRRWQDQWKRMAINKLSHRRSQ